MAMPCFGTAERACQAVNSCFAQRKDNWGDLTCPSGKERGHIIPIRWLATRDQQDCTFVVDNMVCEPGDLNRVGHSALEGAAGLLSLIDPHSWMAVKAGFETNTDGQRIMTSLMMKLLWQMEGDEYELCMKSDRALTQMGACAKSDRSAGTSVSPGVLPVGAPGLKGLEGFVTRRLKGELASLSAFCAEQLKLNTNLAKWLNYFLAPAGNSLKEKLAWCDDNNAEFPDIRFFHQLGLLRALQNADVWKSGGSFIGSADVAAEFLTVKTSQTSLLNEWMEAVTSPQPQPQPAPVGLGRQPKTKVIKKAKKKPRLG
eukprot:PLAT13711.3.p1 GENE.PLAT13711.3~~PLAT13711.3.p1  ORF type:complete len:314 (-),score=49.54 PLAT13711.3:141-1082(-)